MDSFYPKFDEVELVLVDDDNDLFDPLESNFEDENVDTKLQLNDTVEDDSQFHMIADDPPDKLVEEVDLTTILPIKANTPDRICDNSDDSDFVKIENQLDYSSDSFNAGHNDDSSESDNSDNSFSADSKLRATDFLDATSYIDNKTKCKIENEVDSKTDIGNLLNHPTEKKRTKPRSETRKKLAASTSKTRVKSESKSRKQRTDGDTEGNSGEEKSTRHYSKRNEIPKQSVHNEAYDKKLLFCKICNLQFDRSPFFTDHMRSKHSIDKPFECYICSKAYRICSLLAEHIRYHFGEKPYQCESCDRGFSQLQPYKAHVRKFHTNERPYKCNFVDENNIKCEETFFDTKTYKFHLREHTNEQPFTCEFCSKKFNHSGTYQAHMRIHTNERPYQCVICGKSFAQISTHKAHMLTHSDEFKFPCTEPGCDKKFKQATNLKLHLRVHTKETPYKCEDCGRGFAQLVTYRNHRRIHTGEKPFACTYEDCNKAFRHRNSFRRHLQTHTGEKPYECGICFKRLSQTSSYISHMRRHEKPEKS